MRLWGMFGAGAGGASRTTVSASMIRIGLWGFLIIGIV